jgi:tetratricopeptide (TPR) repeat protein
MEFIEKGQNAAAIPKLQSAIRQKSEEGSNIKFYGMKFGDYFPHYYLGMAYNGQGNYSSAVQEFEISEQQGSIQKKKQLFERLSGMKTIAKAKLVTKEPEIAKNIPPTNVPIVKPPEETKTELQVTNPPVEKPEEKPTVTELKPRVEPEKKPEEKIATVIPDKKPPVVVPPITADLDPNSDIRKRYLQNGARKYFEGDYDAAILFLEEVRKLSPADTPVNFLLGCSYASKYLLNGSQNKQLLDSASMMFRRVKKGNPKYQPKSKTYLSPAVLEIYEKTT